MSNKEDNILARIMAERRKDALSARRAIPMEELLGEAERRTAYHSLSDLLRRPSAVPRVIAEVKRASPSAGELRQSYDPAAIAQAYAAAGAVGISVLTEPRHFLGSPGDLRAVRRVVDLPVLRKDFVSDTYQLVEAAAWGADVVLLIVAGLKPGQCEVLYGEARELDLDVIVEVHTADELKVAVECREAIIGVNSRNLKTLTTDLVTAHDLADLIPDGRLCIAESGIRTGADITGLLAKGYDGFLIGESLLREPLPGKALKVLIEEGRGAAC